ncbi:17830_t:CDS:2 [Racocetra persica]|uniref:17830_t:CDS:1 n=1 Tax=Racocetra persica TaxID=160502 RepID=A0ACA9Q3E9_9GLOM|nr:17830_t:CDS:2 [Racocetra persica]
MTIKLIGHPGSGPTLRVSMTLKELGLPYEFEVPADRQAIKTDDFLDNKHPFGKIPVLIDGDFTINESRAICRYLASKYQGKHNATILIPTDVHKAGLASQCISYESFYYDPAITKIVHQEIYAKKLISQCISYESFYSDPPLSKLVQQEISAKKKFNKDPDQEVIKQAREELAKVLDVYEKILEGKEYLNGEFSLADLFHTPSTHYIYSMEAHSKLWDSRPNVKNWWNRLRNRDAIKKVLDEIKS